ncbi:MAG: hypothetical protein ACJA1C_002210 [Crocinitomicaceae bacterium]|jgi:hypothetical protein
MKKLEQKTIDFLQKRGTKIVQDSIEYRDIRKDVEFVGGIKKDMHVLRFLVVSEVEDLLCYIYIPM